MRIDEQRASQGTAKIELLTNERRVQSELITIETESQNDESYAKEQDSRVRARRQTGLWLWYNVFGKR
jgi:hypothetical protein